ncbi:hypothetical protein NL676_039572 [Syzygium grande]|nr:hypothetical protein NL676_039572 [Syzygium grande]
MRSGTNTRLVTLSGDSFGIHREREASSPPCSRFFPLKPPLPAFGGTGIEEASIVCRRRDVEPCHNAMPRPRPARVAECR